VCGCVNYTAVPWEPASTATRDAAPARLGAAPGESVRFYGESVRFYGNEEANKGLQHFIDAAEDVRETITRTQSQVRIGQS